MSVWPHSHAGSDAVCMCDSELLARAEKAEAALADIAALADRLAAELAPLTVASELTEAPYWESHIKSSKAALAAHAEARK